MRTFGIVTAISMVFTLLVAVLSLLGMVVTGFYPGIIVLCLIALVPIASRLYAGKSSHYTLLTVINLLLILVVLWMCFVIVHDRVLHDCC